MSEEQNIAVKPPQHVRIVMHGHGRGEVFVDGVKLPNVTDVIVDVGSEKANRVSITIIPPSLEVAGTFDVTTIESADRIFAMMGDEAPASDRTT